MFDNTKWFFFMLALHMCSGRPVEADCWRAKSSGDCSPSPIGRDSFRYRSAAVFIMPIKSAIGISVRISRARPACRMSRPIRPVFAWLTRASVSPVMKCTTVS